ncbi:TolC family protein [Syntrophorhabdus aromaticivorans]|jgi:outer membrane protein TolC|uniref:TolC family protein n=1 Tax=Syntrophorhabdus aromaticivorans TaxID=328301 RepID=A0A971S282_9BACT|nr:TolC family protein [Syntrophorhabdus aromaticivorans]NLW36002.1 TolC family protein [Syntrophorhabdus aromaticivorans]
MQTGADLSRIYILSAFLVIASILLNTSICSAQTVTTSEMLTLKKAIEAALKNHPTIEAQSGQVAAGEAKLGQARGSYYPQINLSGGYATIWPVSRETAVTTTSSGLPPGNYIPTGSTHRAYEQYAAIGSLSQLLFDFGKTGAQVTVQKMSAEAARHDLAGAKEQVIFDVKQAYYNLLGARRAADVATKSVEQLKKQVERAQVLYEEGAKPRFDVTKAEVDLSNAEVNQAKAGYGVKVATATLNNAMGLPYGSSFTIEDDLSSETTGLSFEEALQIAFAHRPDLLSLQNRKEAALQSVKAAQRAHLPTINGTATLTCVGTEFPMDHGWTAGVAMVLPLFTGFVTSYRVAEANAGLRVATANEKSLRQTIVLELEQGFLALNEATTRIKSTGVALKQAAENAEFAIERYGAGLGIAIEVTDALTAYVNAELAYIGALYDRKIAQARIDKAMGSGLSNQRYSQSL